MRFHILAATFLLACSGGSSDDDGGVEAGPDVQPDVIVDPSNCVPPTATNDNEGVGGYCSPGGGQCATSGPGGAPRICSADLAGAMQHEWYCTYPCTTSTDCGSGAQCIASDQGTVCIPPSCNTMADAAIDAPPDSPTSDAASDASVDVATE